MSYASAAYCALTPGLSSQNPSVNFIYLTAPAVIPRVRVLWKIRKKIKVGISPRRADALVVVTSIRRSPCRTVIATGTVWVAFETKKVNGIKNSFQVQMKKKIRRTDSVGRLIGYTTCHRDRKSTRLNSSHVAISYAVFCLKKIILCSHVHVI